MGNRGQNFAIRPRVQPGSSQVLTHRQYTGPYFIMDKIQGPKIGVAYKLVDVETGKSIKALIGGDRLKKYTADDRNTLNRRLPGIGKESQVKIAKSQPTDESELEGYDPAIRIEREKTSGGKKNCTLFFLKTNLSSGAVRSQMVYYNSIEYGSLGIEDVRGRKETHKTLESM